MDVGNERSQSYWMEDAQRVEAPSLAADLECDVVVIGSGIAGLSTAYKLSRAGRSVAVIDRGGIGTGMMARTTAYVATELDDFYSELIDTHGASLWCTPKQPARGAESVAVRQVIAQRGKFSHRPA